MSSRWTVHLHNRSCRAGRRQWSWPHREESGGEKGSFLLASGSFGVTVDFDDSFGKGLRGFLRQIVPNAALDDPVRIFAREFLGIGTGVRVGCSIGITFKGNGEHVMTGPSASRFSRSSYFGSPSARPSRQR